MKEFPDSVSKHGQPPRYPFEYVRGFFATADDLTDTLPQSIKYIEVNESDIRTPEFSSPR